MGVEKHDFDLRISMIATQRAFRQSFSSGIKQVGLELFNLKTRSQEKAAPESASFSTPIEQRINPLLGAQDLYWPGYELSIDESMTRAIALARKDRMPKDQIKSLYAQREVWRTVRSSVLNLAPDQSVSFIVPRGLSTDTSQGISFGQIEKSGGHLIQKFQLLPVMSEAEIQKLQNTIDQKVQRVSINVKNSNLSSSLGWISTGRPIDLQNELPGIIKTVRQPQARINNIANLSVPRDSFMTMPSFVAGARFASQTEPSFMKNNMVGVSANENLSDALSNKATHKLEVETGVFHTIPILMVVAAESLPVVAADLVVVEAMSVDQSQRGTNVIAEELSRKSSEAIKELTPSGVMEEEPATVEIKQNSAIVFFNDRTIKDNGRKDKSNPQSEVKIGWDNKIVARFREATTTTVAQETKHLQSNVTASKADMFIAPKPEIHINSETKFREFASDMVVIDIGAQNTQAVAIEETATLLLPKAAEETTIRPIEEKHEKVKPAKNTSPHLLFLTSDMAQAFLAWQQRKTYADLPTEPPDFFLKKSTSTKNEAGFDEPPDNSYLKHSEKNQQAKQLRVKTQKPSLAFLSLLFLIKLKLQAQNTSSFTKLKKLFLTDSLLMFLLKPNLFLAPRSSVARPTTSCYNEKIYEFTAQ
ncbi:hypothetical protein HY030_03200 [Candidatus Gottesmanbacteria bacterium]|nr:hypothetical protein [Candidatus Gottesmanbacteria bacterium]